MSSVALYQFPDRTLLRRFTAPATLNCIALSSNEQFLLLACSDGSLSLWNVKTGERLWEQTQSETGLGYVYDASMSYDGESCVAGGVGGNVLVVETRTGRHVVEIGLLRGERRIMSVALAPDGRTGALVDLGERVYTFDVDTGGLTRTGITGAQPIRYSADGKYIACASGRSGSREHLRVLPVEKLAARDLGEFETIGHIRPVEDGSFLITAIDPHLIGETETRYIGAQVWPAKGELRELWRFPSYNTLNEETDFLADTMIGASTYFRLKTYLTDLRTGEHLMSVDNSANYRMRLVSSSSFGIGWGFLVCAGLGIIVVFLLIAIFRRSQPERIQ